MNDRGEFKKIYLTDDEFDSKMSHLFREGWRIISLHPRYRIEGHGEDAVKVATTVAFIRR